MLSVDESSSAILLSAERETDMMRRLFGGLVRHEVEIYGTLPDAEMKAVSAMLRKAVRTTLAHEGVTEKTHVDIMLTDNAHIHEINLEQRGVDRPTDVLSFPMNELTAEAFDAAECMTDPSNGRILLGDMVISLEQCRAQAEEFGHSAEREICYLAVHSVLHLLGYDHMDEGEQKAQMRRHEDAVMDKLKLSR